MRFILNLLISEQIIPVVFVLISFTNILKGQVVDIASESDGIIIPRVSEYQRKTIDHLVEGLLLYQIDMNHGFYYYNGKDWLQLNNSVEGKAKISINGNEPSKYGLRYIGPTGGSGTTSASNQFVSDYGYYVTIMNYDSLSNTSLFFSNENCSGNMYVSSVIAGRGYIGRGKSNLYFVEKDATPIREIVVKSNQIFSHQGSECINYTTSMNFMYPIKLNEPEITGIDIDPNAGYKVYFKY